jgi:hypothetical protein
MALSAMAPEMTNASSNPSWLVLQVGQSAYLRSDGGGATSATLCDTARHYQRALDIGTPVPGCSSHKPGLRVKMLSIAQGAWLGQTIRIVKVQASSTVGWVSIMQLDPLLPRDTSLLCPVKTLYSSRTSVRGRSLSETKVVVKVLADFPDLHKHDLFVRIMAGGNARRTGYIDASDCRLLDGLRFADLFEYNSRPL